MLSGLTLEEMTNQNHCSCFPPVSFLSVRKVQQYVLGVERGNEWLPDYLSSLNMSSQASGTCIKILGVHFLAQFSWWIMFLFPSKTKTAGFRMSFPEQRTPLHLSSLMNSIGLFHTYVSTYVHRGWDQWNCNYAPSNHLDGRISRYTDNEWTPSVLKVSTLTVSWADNSIFEKYFVPSRKSPRWDRVTERGAQGVDWGAGLFVNLSHFSQKSMEMVHPWVLYEWRRWVYRRSERDFCLEHQTETEMSEGTLTLGFDLTFGKPSSSCFSDVGLHFRESLSKETKRRDIMMRKLRSSILSLYIYC